MDFTARVDASGFADEWPAENAGCDESPQAFMPPAFLRERCNRWTATVFAIVKICGLRRLKQLPSKLALSALRVASQRY